ncbi:Uu.00g064700.m01.CDS01 [Anthostomella pinea]|uniref:Uu.00g064700.m01.CDS01 n=1 Tax=Anthostomella pinea TaxID=933095 RepID=A0AAI8VUF1_9PEZI|nr:Uu.00g064700.m01.CDS01 [Anthostomella pinea]
MASSSCDFVIAGGGTAGLVLASRLTEDGSQSVLVIEAGADQSGNLQVKIPAFYAANFDGDADWNFSTKAQKDLHNRAVPLNQGRGLGGSSILNAQIWGPPTKGISDSWASLGNDGWNWDSLRHFHDMSYTYPSVPESSWKTLGLRSWPEQKDSNPGPITTSFPNATHPIRVAWAETLAKLGYPMSKDPPVKDRENIHVLTNATAERVIFEEGSTKAIGLQYRHNSSTTTVIARKEVIICSGAIQSPKLLELSGIGNREILAQHGIETIVDLCGVGEGLQDHLAVDIGFEAEALERGTLPQDGSRMPFNEQLPINLPSPSGHQQLRMLLEQNRPKQDDLPDRELARASAFYRVAEKALLDPASPSEVYRTSLGHNPFESDPVNGERTLNPLPGTYLTLVGILAHPTSRGNVHIQSANASVAPVIDPKYLSNPVDIEVFAEHVLYLQSLASSPPLSGLLKQPLRPSRAISYMADLEAAKEYIRIRAVSMWHPAGTCAMMPAEMGGVVDNHLRVHGVENLRVVDASVIPVLPPANLQSAVYAVAERAACLIKSQYGLK